MAAFDVSLQGFNTYLSTHAGRDQVGKLVNYGARFFVALFADLSANLPKDSPRRAQLEAWRVFFSKLMTVVGDARRTVRWFASLGVIIALRKLGGDGVCPWTNKTAFAAAQLGLLWWHLTDNYRWLLQHNLFPSLASTAADKTRWKNISFTGFVVSSAVGTGYFAHKVLSPPAGMLVDPAKEAEARRGFAKNALTLVATLHISEILVTSELLCGVCGAATAAIVIYETFPKKAPAKKE